jgi:hypothetical protein
VNAETQTPGSGGLRARESTLSASTLTGGPPVCGTLTQDCRPGAGSELEHKRPEAEDSGRTNRRSAFVPQPLYIGYAAV